MHFVIGLLFLRLIASAQSKCPDDFCRNSGICHLVSDYLASTASLDCLSGWMKGKDKCYRVIWTMSQQYVAKELCSDTSGASLAQHQDINQLSVLAPQLINLMSTMQVDMLNRPELWTSYCNASGCEKVKPPFYNSTGMYDKRHTETALPLCTMPPSFNRQLKQCKCPEGWGGERCDVVPNQADTDDKMVCKEMSCPRNTRLHVEFAAHGYYPGISACKEMNSFGSSSEKDFCMSPNSLAAVKYWCQGKRRCDIMEKLQPISVILNKPCQSASSTMTIRRSCKKNLIYCPTVDDKKSILVNGDTCWHLIQGELSWREALDYCKVQGGSLAFVPPVSNATLIPKEFLDQMSYTSFNIWIDVSTGPGRGKGTAIPGPQTEDCPHLHVDLQGANATPHKVKENDKLKCSLAAGPLYPWVCTFSPDNGRCLENGTLNEGICYKMIHELKYWGEAKADCEKFPQGHLVSYSEKNKKVLLNYLAQQMRERVLDFWIAGVSEDSRDIYKNPEPCTSGQVNSDTKVISTEKKFDCPLQTKKKFALCALPPNPQEENYETSNSSTFTSFESFTEALSFTTPFAAYTNMTIITKPTHRATTTHQSTMKTQFKKSCKKRLFIDSRGISEWPETGGDETQTLPCPGKNSVGVAKWFCNGTIGEFDPLFKPNWTDCRVLTNLQDLVEKEKTENLDQKTQVVLDEIQEKPLYGSDLKEVLEFVKEVQQEHEETLPQVKDQYQSTRNFTELITDIIDQLLSQHNILAWLDYPNETERAPMSTQLLTSVDTAGFSLASVLVLNTSIEIEKKTVDLHVSNMESRFYKSNPIIKKFQSDSIQIPNDVISKSQTTVKSVFTKYKNLSVILPSNQLVGNQFNQFRLNSEVIGASFGSGNTTYRFENDFVIIKSRHIKDTSPGSSGICVFWNLSTGYWDTNGCINNMTNQTHTICYCNHLTNFAVLMDVNDILEPDSIHSIVLTWITIVGCSLSIVCLSISCFIFIVFRALWSLRSTIHCNLCACLAVAQLILLVGLDRTENRVFCAIVAGLLHFAWLAAFAWVALEGVHIYVLLVKVFDTAEKKIWLYYLTGYGLPALTVAISATCKPSGYGTKKYCWLSTDNGFLFSFAMPMLVVILFNCVIFVFAMKAAASVKAQRNDCMVEKTKLWIRRSASLIPLLGLTWLFGFMYADNNSIIFAYFFAIFNSAQGLFIFIFHCARNEKVQQVVSRYVALQRERSASSFFNKSRSNSCTATSSVRTTASTDDAGGLSKAINRSLQIQALPSRWRFELHIAKNEVTPWPNERARLKGLSFKLFAEGSV